MIKTLQFSDGELWYGGAVDTGEKYPLNETDEYFLDTTVNGTPNQLNPVFLSNKGRYIWLENGGSVRFDRGTITVDAPNVDFCTAGNTLKDAALSAAQKHYPPSGTMPDKRAFLAPQYCSWVVHLWSQNQQKLLEYARSIVKNGYKPGLLIIDDTWQKDYGVWEFNPAYFPDPKAMMKELKELGFLVSLWISPYISPDSPKSADYAPWIFDHMQAGRVIMNGDRPRFVGWWEGYSAALDFTEAAAKKWINENTHRLERDYGVSGFKMDGGDPMYWDKEYKDGNLQSMLWIDSIDNAFKESRCCYKLGGKPIIQRLNDKRHLWKSDGNALGLSALLPCIMTQGLVGYPFGCADMVGGGASADFIDKSNLDDELIIRWCQASALLPMIQFSLDVWNRKENRVDECCKKALDLRETLLPYLIEKLEEAAHTGVPAVRFLEFEFPNSGLDGITDEFMLGEKYLVAPVLEKGAMLRQVAFPDGKWRDMENGKVYLVGKHTVDAPIEKLPVFERIDCK